MKLVIAGAIGYYYRPSASHDLQLSTEGISVATGRGIGLQGQLPPPRIVSSLYPEISADINEVLNAIGRKVTGWFQNENKSRPIVHNKNKKLSIKRSFTLVMEFSRINNINFT